MRCSKARKGLGALLDGELDPTAAGELRGHIESCLSCRSALEELESVESFLGDALAPPPVPSGFAARLADQARRRATENGMIREAEPLPSGFGSPSTVLMRVAAALVFAVGLTLGSLMGWSTWRGRTSESRPAAVAEADPLEIYSADCLTDAPEGSLTEAYMSVLTSPAGEE